MADDYEGSCFCGAVTIGISGTEIAAGYCHCRDCTRWAAAPVSSYAIFPAGSVRVTGGADALGSFAKTDHVTRKFCTRCGGHVYCELPAADLEEVFPDVVPALGHRPTMHIHYGSRTLPMADGLPKFRDMPAELGGSGETLPD